MTAQLLQIEKSIVRLACIGCGAEAVATCSCHKPYKPIDAAIAAVKANPGKSNRAIADETGVSLGTVNNARKEAGEQGCSPDRLGRDGKTYPAEREDTSAEDRKRAYANDESPDRHGEVIEAIVETVSKMSKSVRERLFAALREKFDTNLGG